MIGKMTMTAPVQCLLILVCQIHLAKAGPRKVATRSREMPTSKHATILWTLSLTSRPVSTSLASATKEGIAHASVQR